MPRFTKEWSASRLNVSEHWVVVSIYRILRIYDIESNTVRCRFLNIIAGSQCLMITLQNMQFQIYPA